MVRRVPVPGLPVTVVFLGAREPGVVEEVAEDGQAVVVATADQVLHLRLNATGHFVTADRSARLVFDP